MMKLKCRAVFLVLILLFLSACSTDVQQGSRANIIGKLQFPTVPEAGIAGFGAVSIWLDGQEYTISDIDGRFSFHGVTVGEHVLEIRDKFHYAEPLKIYVAENGVQVKLPVFYNRAYYESFFRAEAPEGYNLYVNFLWNKGKATSVKIDSAELLTESQIVESIPGHPGLFSIKLKNELVECGKQYPLQFTFYQGAEVLEEVIKEIYLPAFGIQSVKYSFDTPQQPTIQWSSPEIEGIKDYILRVYKVGDIMTSYYVLTTETEYTLKNKLVPGQYFATISVYIVEPLTGNSICYLDGNQFEFTVE